MPIDNGRVLIGFDPLEFSTAPLATNPAQPDFQNVDYREMAVRWQLIDNLCGGTVAMRQAGQQYLPMEMEEDPISWQLRLSRSYLHEAFSDTLDKLVTKPFSAEITFDELEKLDPRLQFMLDDVDYEGSTITDFMARVKRSAIKYGHSFVLCDYPVAKEGLTLKDEIQGNIRPYLTHIEAPAMIGWKSRKSPRGVRVLTQIRFFENSTEADGEYGEKSARFIREINAPTETQRGYWRLHKEVKPGHFEVVDQADHNFPGIPIRPFYTKKVGYMKSTPPLEKLAWLNLMHWQSQSDQRNILRIARCGVLFLKGVDREEDPGYVGKRKKIVITNNRAIYGENEWSDAFWVEHKGDAIAAGRQDLVDIENKMVMMGMEPFVEKNNDSSATGRAIRESNKISQSQQWSRGCEHLIYDLVAMGNVWINGGRAQAFLELPDGFKANIFNEYFITIQAYEDMRLLLEAAKNNRLTNRTLLNEFKRRGMVSESLNVEKEAKEVSEMQEEAAQNAGPASVKPGRKMKSSKTPQPQ